MAWLKDCLICNTGLCKAVDELKAQGLSENAACKQMSQKSDGLYSGEAIKGRYRHHTGKVKTRACENHTPTKLLATDEEKELYQLYAKLKRLTKAAHRANPDQDSIYLQGASYIKLKGAKKGFYRSVNEYPGEGTEKQLLIWKIYFECQMLRKVADAIGHCFHKQLPKELPENCPKPKKKKPAKPKKIIKPR